MKYRNILLVLGFTLFVLLTSKASAFWVLELKEAAFTYHPEATPEYQQSAAQLKTQYSNTVKKQDYVNLYAQIDQKYSLESTLKQWSAQGGPAPQQFRVKLVVRNYGNEASKPCPLKIILTTKVGQYLVDQKTFLVDEDYLQQTAKWQPYAVIEGSIPSIAPTESYTFLSVPIPWGAFITSLKQQFPVMLKADIKIKNRNKAVHDSTSLNLPMAPGHFALEDLSE